MLSHIEPCLLEPLRIEISENDFQTPWAGKFVLEEGFTQERGNDVHATSPNSKIKTHQITASH
jgi:hypothetical protein